MKRVLEGSQSATEPFASTMTKFLSQGPLNAHVIIYVIQIRSTRLCLLSSFSIANDSYAELNSLFLNSKSLYAICFLR